jgi:hypothetical protein
MPADPHACCKFAVGQKIKFTNLVKLELAQVFNNFQNTCQTCQKAHACGLN